MHRLPLPPATARLTWELLSAADAEFLCELMNEPAYLKHIGDRGVRTPADARRFLRERLLPHYDAHGYGLYRVTFASVGTSIGICGFVRRDFLDGPDLGFAFLEQFTGRGLGCEAATAILAWGLTQFSFSHVYGIVAPGNAPSLSLLAKLGFQRKGTLCLPQGPENLLLVRQSDAQS